MKFKKEWSLRKNDRKNEVGSVNMFFETEQGQERSLRLI